MAPEPFNSLIVVADIERYGSRSDIIQAALRRGVHDIVREAIRGAGLAAGDCHIEDRGDSVLVVAPKAGPVAVLGGVVRELDQAVGEWNRAHAEAYAIRLRVAVHNGFVWQDANGWVGTAINATTSLAKSKQVDEALAGDSQARIAVIVGEGLYRDIVAMGHRAIDAAGYRDVRVNADEREITAWVYVPSGNRVAPVTAPGGAAQPPDPGPGNPPPARADTGVRHGTTNIGIQAGGDVRGEHIIGIQNVNGSR